MSLKLVRRSRSPHWVIRGSIRGIRIEESTGTGDRKVAEEFRAKREAEIHATAIYGHRAVATFAQAALSYMEAGGSKRYLEPIILHFGTASLAKIDQDALDRGARKLFSKGAPSTRNRQFYTPTSAVLHHAARRGWCAPPLIERPAVPEGRVRWLPIDEADRLIDACAPHLRPQVIFWFYTGARVGEALWLDWHDVNLAAAHVTFPKTKNGDAREVPLHPRVVAALANLPHRTGEVFRTDEGSAYARLNGGEDHSAGSRVKTAFRAACRRAGIENFSPHDCRHTWATWHYAMNRDLGALQKLGGWKSVRMVMRYAHVNVAELAPSINRLPGGKLGDTDNADTQNRKEAIS